MKVLLYASCIISLFLTLFSLTEEKNIEIIIHLDNDITEEEQTVYLWSFCSWVSGSEKAIWDSASIKKGQKTVKLQGYAPYENYFKICFSKNGPQGLYVYALPNDTVELYLSSNDKEVLWKNAYKGNYHNIVTDFEKGSRRYWIKKNESSEDSISYYSHLLIDRYINEIHTSEHPLIAKGSWVMLQMFFKDSLSRDSLQSLREYVARKFPNYPPAALTHKNAPTLSERTKSTQKRLDEISRRRGIYEKRKQNTQIGSRITLQLPSLNGEYIALSDLRSKYIFVDIWASWCKPCRAQTIYLKKVLNKYQNNIKIYAVSIDANHSAWKKAIEQDKTQDFIHVIGTDSDRRSVRSVEVLDIERIPRNFLLDRNCRIIAKDLLDEQLMQTLDSLERQ